MAKQSNAKTVSNVDELFGYTGELRGVEHDIRATKNVEKARKLFARRADLNAKIDALTASLSGEERVEFNNRVAQRNVSLRVAQNAAMTAVEHAAAEALVADAALAASGALSALEREPVMAHIERSIAASAPRYAAELPPSIAAVARLEFVETYDDGMAAIYSVPVIKRWRDGVPVKGYAYNVVVQTVNADDGKVTHEWVASLANTSLKDIRLWLHAGELATAEPDDDGIIVVGKHSLRRRVA